MNWDALGAVAELLGAIAVFLTLAYLTIQVRQNSAALLQQNKFSAAQIMQAKTDTFMHWCSFAVNETNNKEIMGKALFETDGVSMDALKSGDKMQLIILMAAMRSFFETTFQQVEQGFLTKDYYDGSVVTNSKMWGPAFIKLGTPMSQEFKAEVERILLLPD